MATRILIVGATGTRNAVFASRSLNIHIVRAGYLGNTILRTLLGRADRTNLDITIGIRDEAIANKFRKDEVKVRILDLNDSSALEQAAEESDGQLTSLKR